ncbi:unnamed protein product, partial [Mycena citricolor]
HLLALRLIIMAGNFNFYTDNMTNASLLHVNQFCPRPSLSLPTIRLQYMSSFAQLKAQRTARLTPALSSASTSYVSPLSTGGRADVPITISEAVSDSLSISHPRQEQVSPVDGVGDVSSLERGGADEDEGGGTPAVEEMAGTTAPSASSPKHARDADEDSGRAEGLYAALPSALRIRVSQDAVRGRGVYMGPGAGCTPGQTLIKTRPHVGVLAAGRLATHCSGCFRAGRDEGSLKRCTLCRVVWYCGSTCQSADWAAHKPECAGLRRVIASSGAGPSDSPSDIALPSDAVRCLARMAWGRARKRTKAAQSIWVREVDGLSFAPPATAPSDKQAQEKQSLHTHLALALVHFMGVQTPAELAAMGFGSGRDLAEFVGKVACYSITPCAPLNRCASSPPIPSRSRMKHWRRWEPAYRQRLRCSITRVSRTQSWCFPPGTGRCMLLRFEISRRGRRCILTSYIDTTLPRHMRQEALLETYHFTCDCTLCSDAAVDPRDAVWCPKRPECDGICRVPTDAIPLSLCAKCRAVLRKTDEVIDAVRVGTEALAKAERVQFADPSKARQLASKMTPILRSAGLHPGSYPLLALSRMELASAIEDLPSSSNTLLDAAIHTSTMIVSGLTSILTPGHPVRGLALAELARLCAADESSPDPTPTPNQNQNRYPYSGPARLRLALDTMQRALSELAVGFGMEGGVIGRLIREEAVRVERELSVWKEGVRNVRDLS